MVQSQAKMKILLVNFKKHMEREQGLKKLFPSMYSSLIFLYKTFQMIKMDNLLVYSGKDTEKDKLQNSQVLPAHF